MNGTLSGSPLTSTTPPTMNTALCPPSSVTYPMAWPVPAISSVEDLLALIESEATAILSHPAADRLRRGDVTPAVTARILANVAFQSFHGPITFALSGARVASSHPTIGKYLIEHAGEETGHWQWAIEDLAQVPDAPSPRDLQPSAEALAYAGWNHFQANCQPLTRIASAALLERMSTRCGDIIAGLIGTAASDQRSTAFRFVRNHATTDLTHWAEIQAVLRGADLSAADLGILAWAVCATRSFYIGLYAQPLAQCG